MATNSNRPIRYRALAGLVTGTILLQGLSCAQLSIEAAAGLASSIAGELIQDLVLEFFQVSSPLSFLMAL